MVTLRKVIPVLCLATSLAGIAAYAQTTATAPATTTPGAHQWHRHGHHGGGMFFVLHKLNLTADQKTQIKSIMAGEKSQYEALRTSVKANHTALATTPPTDPNYATLIQTEQSQCDDPDQAAAARPGRRYTASSLRSSSRRSPASSRRPSRRARHEWRPGRRSTRKRRRRLRNSPEGQR